jgi:hypothetical protein
MPASNEGVGGGSGRPSLPRRQEDRPPALSAWKDEDVLAWVERMRVKGLNRDEIMAASKDGLGGWPLVGRHLPQNAADRCIAILEDRANTGRRRSAGGMKKDAGKALHEVYKRRKAGDEHDASLYQARVELIKYAGILESIDFPELGVREATQDMLVDIHADLLRADKWLEASLAVIDQHLDTAHKLELIRKLREDNWGRTPQEIETFHRRANILEARLYAKQLVS